MPIVFAQQRIISGKVTMAEDGLGLPGATVVAKGTTIGTTTDANGVFKLEIPTTTDTIIFAFVGLETQKIALTTSAVYDLSMQQKAKLLEGIVVTALGISREKKSLGYATQEIKGDMVSTVKSDNFVNGLSGKVSGVQVKKTTNMGGSTNIVLRGSKSLTGENQVLFVVDGIPISNSNSNSTDQQSGGLGYDFGNAASDINPDDIESINVLKGSAATALYGSRAAGGVVMIVTKKGAKSKDGAKRPIGITFSSGVTMGFIDKSTFPKYQQDYGAGYGYYYDNVDGSEGGQWYMRDINGDGINEQCALTSEDASYGAAFNPNLNVYQWDAFDPESPNYRKATPWVAAKNGPITFFDHPVTYNNSISLENANDNGSYRFSYSNFNQKGLMPNSKLVKDNVLMNGSWKVNDKLTASGSANFIKTTGTGRNSTGYSDNIMGSFRQWYQTNVDIKQLEDAYNATGRNVTWNYADPTDLQPIFWDNYYWTRFENYENDGRNRFLGNIALNYKVNSWIDVMGRASTDSYNERQEERRAVGSIPSQFGIGSGSDGSGGRSDQGSGYLRRDITFSENNYDLMVNMNRDIRKDLNLKGVVGSNVRRTNYNRIVSSTNGGLGIANLYSLQNSVDPLPYPKEVDSKIGVNGLFASASLGYKNTYYIDLTARRDHSSTLPVGKNIYYYPSVAGSMIFSNLLPKFKNLSFGKIRLNYAQVGNSAGFDQLTDRYSMYTPFNSPVSSVASVKRNPNLKPEKTNSIESGLEMFFFNRRIGFDIAVYKTNTSDQILPLATSTSTGYSTMIINAGEIENKGLEASLIITPIKKTNFKWECTLNWSKNYNKVVSLLEGLDNLQLGSYQGGVTINAMVGQPYGVLYGTDYVYLNGKKVVDADGYYLQTATSDNVIGNVNPDWNGGIYNSFTYKNWSFGFLIDMQKGGDIYSLDMAYGLSTGLYEETSYINDKGMPVRNTLADGGGFINEGVYADGTPNTTRVDASEFGAFGSDYNPNKAFIYDASYVKLREISLSYIMPKAMLEKTFIKGLTLSIVGSNVWIIFKNLPYADPESGLGAGNLQGYSTGSLPSTRDFGFNMKFNF